MSAALRLATLSRATCTRSFSVSMTASTPTNLFLRNVTRGSQRSLHSSAAAWQDAPAAENTNDGSRQDPLWDTKPEDAGDVTVNPKFNLVEGKGEYSPEVTELAERIVKLNLIEVSELCDLLKDKMGIDDAEFFLPFGAVGSAPAPAADEEAAAPEPVKEEKTHFDIMLKGYDAKSKIKIIKEVRGLAGLGLKEAKELVESVPTALMKDMKKEEAEVILEKLKELGAEVELE